MQYVYYTLFPSDAKLESDHITYTYSLPDDFCASKNERKIIIEDFQFWEKIVEPEENQSDVTYYEARSGICLHGDFADLSVSVKTDGSKASGNLNFIGLSNNDGTWFNYKEFLYQRKQRYIKIKFRDLLGNFLTNENYQYIFAVVMKLVY